MDVYHPSAKKIFFRHYNRMIYQQIQICASGLQEDVYLRELVRYIHLNPVRAGIVPTLSELARRLRISVSGVGYSVERGKIIARETDYQLIE